MNRARVTYLALGAFVSVASCTKEAAEPDVYDWADGKIYFRPTVTQVVATRAQDMTLDRLGSFQVSCFNTPFNTAATGFASPYFANATFVRKTEAAAGTAYVSSPDEGPRDWPANSGTLRFFAFSPTLPTMGLDLSALNGTDADYRLRGIHIDPDISRQFDLVTAEASGERWKDFTGGVELAFRHQLSQVELRAWGTGAVHDFEIAGVRIGNPAVDGDFLFAEGVSANSSRWDNPRHPVGSRVGYRYRSASDGAAGDRIYRINSREHNTSASAASIMGLGGCAMVMPTKNSRWEGLGDPATATLPYSTDRMYFSLLVRVTDSATGSVVYPYPDNPQGMTVVSYAVDASGEILQRVYAGPAAGSYFTDESRRNPYTPPDGTTVKDFGWAAVPVDADWSAGKRYVYTLDYSEGIGLHDPEDPEPGKPIGGESSISWGVSVGNWDYARKGENYDPDINVPFE